MKLQDRQPPATASANRAISPHSQRASARASRPRRGRARRSSYCPNISRSKPPPARARRYARISCARWRRCRPCTRTMSRSRASWRGGIRSIWSPAPSCSTIGSGRYRNRAYFVAPDGKLAFQDKLTLTGFERDGERDRARRRAQGVRYRVRPHRHRRLLRRRVSALRARAGRGGRARVSGAELHRHRRRREARARRLPGARAREPGLRRLCGHRGRGTVESGARRQHRHAAIYTPIDRGFPSDGVAARATDGRGLGVARTRSRGARCVQARGAGRQCERLAGATAPAGGCARESRSL